MSVEGGGGMSISSSNYADHANTMKARWTAALTAAIESGDMERVRKVVDDMKEFFFSE